MIAYSQEWLDTLLTKAAAREWHAKGLLSDEKWHAIEEAHPSHFYSPNPFIRIGLAIFCLVLLLAVMGLAGLFLKPDSETGFSVFCMVWGVIWILVLDFWAIRSARHFGSGVDDMLLYAGTAAIVGGIWSLLPYQTSVLMWCCLAWPFLVAGSLRYLDRLMAAAAFCCSLLIILLLVKDIPKLALYLLPFTGMIASAAGLYFARYGQQRYSWRHFNGELIVVELLALVTFYASGNYWIVQQVGLAFFELEQAPMAWFFWAFTFLAPACYLFLGFRRKDRLMLDVGLACTAVAVFTFRYYFHVLPWAWAAAIGGAVLFASAYFYIRYLRQHPGPYVYEAGSKKSLLQEVQEQLIEQTIANQPAAVPAQKDTMGGGQFGGGGASGEF